MTFIKRIHTEIEVDIASESVWDVFSDFNNYENWNPFFYIIEKSGDELNIKSQIGKFKAKILENITGALLTWEGRLGNSEIFFVGRHSFVIKKISNNKTLFVNTENFKGILASVLWPFIHRKIESHFIAMNFALKAECEKKLTK